MKKIVDFITKYVVPFVIDFAISVLIGIVVMLIIYFLYRITGRIEHWHRPPTTGEIASYVVAVIVWVDVRGKSSNKKKDGE